MSADAILLPRQPELRDLALQLKDLASPSPPSRLFVHPDPTLSAEELEDYAAYNATFKTPTSLSPKKLAGLQLGISVSQGDAKEERALGLSQLHLEDATRIVARQTLAAGATLVYGGALGSGPGQFTEALFEMIGAYNKDGFVKIAPLINYAAWPWSEEVDAAWLASRRKMMTVKPWPLPPGVPKPDPGAGPGKVTRLAATPEGRYVLARSLSHMRAEITQRTHARVVLGGKPDFIPGHHARYCRRGTACRAQEAAALCVRRVWRRCRPRDACAAGGASGGVDAGFPARRIAGVCRTRSACTSASGRIIPN